ncbi:hypothetical protein T492DRAFT_70949 [Pavlovales sp. CCMP2436]|nr:hypothetical protein T492DRAFT_70949 [Pavlovales sp. CCMP2436]
MPASGVPGVVQVPLVVVHLHVELHHQQRAHGSRAALAAEAEAGGKRPALVVARVEEERAAGGQRAARRARERDGGRAALPDRARAPVGAAVVHRAHRVGRQQREQRPPAQPHARLVQRGRGRGRVLAGELRRAQHEGGERHVPARARARVQPLGRDGRQARGERPPVL